MTRLVRSALALAAATVVVGACGPSVATARKQRGRVVAHVVMNIVDLRTKKDSLLCSRSNASDPPGEPPCEILVFSDTALFRKEFDRARRKGTRDRASHSHRTRSRR